MSEINVFVLLRLSCDVYVLPDYVVQANILLVRESIKSASTIGPGRGGTSYLTDFDETWPVWRTSPKNTSVQV